MKQRIISLIMALVMTLTLLPTPTWATTKAEPQIAPDQAQAQDQAQEAQEEQTPVQTTSSQDEPVKEETSQTAGSFLLLAVNNVGVIIAPEPVSYTAGQTIAQALAASGHRFTGLNTETSQEAFISAIDGETGKFLRTDETGDYQLARPASDVKAIMFLTCLREIDGETAAAVYQLACAMLAWQQAEKPVQRYSQGEYDKAKTALIAGGDFAAQAAALTAKMAEYQQYIDADKIPLNLSFAGLDGSSVTSYTFTAEDIYGNSYSFTDTQPVLSAGRYTFTLTAGYNGAAGEMTVDAAGNVTIGGDTVTTLRLPQGLDWIAEPVLLAKENGTPWEDAYPQQSDLDAHTATVLLPDTVGPKRGSLFLYGVTGKNLQNYQWEGYDVVLYAMYQDVSGSETEQSRRWEMPNQALTDAVNADMQDTDLRLEARAEIDGYTAYQTWQLSLKRTPTLSGLDVTAGDVRQNIGFSSAVKEYHCTVTTANVVLHPVCPSSYTVTVNGTPLEEDGSYTLPLEAEETTAVITVSAPESQQTTTYTLTIAKTAAVPLTVVHEAGVTVRIYNAAGTQIGQDDNGTYPLTPDGSSYTCIATKDTYYHTKMVFSAPKPADSGLTIQAVTPTTENHLTNLKLTYDNKDATVFLRAEDFQTEKHQYDGVKMDDFYARMYVTASADAGYTITAQTTDGGEIPVGTAATLLSDSVKEGPDPFTLTVRVFRAETVQGKAVTYEQDYLVNFIRLLTLYDAELTVEGAETPFYQTEDGKATDNGYFDNEVYTYQATILASARSAELIVEPFLADYRVQVGGKTYSPQTDPETGKAAETITVPLSLSGTLDSETFTLRADADGVHSAREYTFTFLKGDPVATTITVTDTKGAPLSGALAAVYDDRSHTRVWPEKDGKFYLVDGITYTCVATCPGYVGQEIPFTAGDSQKQQTIRLTAAEASVHGEGVSSDWPYFRKNEDNNGVVNVETPWLREETVLSWANKLGDGFGASALSSPILITQDGVDYLIVYSSTTLFKVEAVTGAVVATGAMSAASDYAITSATFGDGMLFVGLENGTVQAFDADTLTSLWIYRDPLAGQPNSPLTYADHCVYTGFWNDETEDANFVCLTTTDEDPDRSDETKLARWAYTAKGGFYWAGAYVDPNGRFLLVGTDDGDAFCVSSTSALLCLDPATGKTLDKLENLKGDIRCSITRADDCFYFVSKGGCFYSVAMNADGTAFDRESLWKVDLQNGGSSDATPAMSTSTPVIRNGRAYVGVSGTSQFGAYSGHNITVIDLPSRKIAYSVPTMGYPQTSGLLTTAYGTKTYVYFFDNLTPGKLRVLEDSPNQPAPTLLTKETYQNQGKTETLNTAYVLFTPQEEHSQYAICSPITDDYGTLFFKNDSAHLMALTSAVTGVAVKQMPNKVTYARGEKFDPTGMILTVTYANGNTRDLTFSAGINDINGQPITYFACDSDTVEDGDFRITYKPLLYGSDEQGKATYPSAGVTISLTVTNPRGDVNGDGRTDVYDLQRLYEHCRGIQPLSEETLQEAGIAGTAIGMQDMYAYLTEGAWDGGAHTVKVKESAVTSAQIPQGQQYILKMSDVFAACKDAQYTLGDGDFGTQTKLARDSSGSWYLSFTNRETGDYTLTITAACGSRSCTHTLTITVIEGDSGSQTQYGYDETDADSVTVYVTISNDGVPLIGRDGTVLSHLQVTVPYFDLEYQGLAEYYRYKTENGQGSYTGVDVVQRPTLLHLYLYLLGVYCQGWSVEDVTRGGKTVLNSSSNYVYRDLLGTTPAAGAWNNLTLYLTGSATSMYMQQFWGHDENLMYYRNHVFPLMSAGWGATADYILLSDGDTVDLAMFSDYTFHTRGAFACFDQDHYTVQAGKALTFQTLKYDTRDVSDGGSGGIDPIDELAVRVYNENWQEVSISPSPNDAASYYTVTFETPGTYYLLALDPDAGGREACYAPATACVTVR